MKIKQSKVQGTNGQSNMQAVQLQLMQLTLLSDRSMTGRLQLFEPTRERHQPVLHTDIGHHACHIILRCLVVQKPAWPGVSSGCGNTTQMPPFLPIARQAA